MKDTEKVSVQTNVDHKGEGLSRHMGLKAIGFKTIEQNDITQEGEGREVGREQSSFAGWLLLIRP